MARNTVAKIVYGASSNNWLFSHKQVRAARHQEFLFSQGITDYDPLRKGRRSRLGQLTTGRSLRNPPAARMGVRCRIA